MILRLICPTGHVLDVDSQLAGRKIRCGACGSIMLVPTPPANRAKPKPAKKPPPAVAVKPGAKPAPTSPLPPKAASPAISAAESPKAAPPELTPMPPATVARPPVVELPAEATAEQTPIVALRDEPVPTETVSQPAAEIPPIAPMPLAVESAVTEPPLEAIFDLTDHPIADSQLAIELKESSAQPTVELPPARSRQLEPVPFEQFMEPTAEPPSADLPAKASEAAVAKLPLEKESPISPVESDEAVTLQRSRGFEFLAWLHRHLPSRPTKVPADAIEPSWTERRTARHLAAVMAGAAALSLLPVVVLRQVNLLAAPPWALWSILLAAVQLVYAGWLVSAPDCVTARVQMVVSATMTTVYAMIVTLVLVTPQSRPLILGLGDVRQPALAWCGLMFFVMAVVTGYAGSTATRWRRQLAEEYEQMRASYFAPTRFPASPEDDLAEFRR